MKTPCLMVIQTCCLECKYLYFDTKFGLDLIFETVRQRFKYRGPYRFVYLFISVLRFSKNI